MKRLSRTISEMRGHYSAVVVGSGYGGAITACRIARAGRDVCVLERGRELHPGQYPRSGLAALRQTQWHTTTAHHGPVTGMFDFHIGPDITVVVGCGLGGTSLINAGVALEASSSIFDCRWPTALRAPEALKPYLHRARDMLGSNPYPESWPDLPRLETLEHAAKGLGHTVRRPDLNVTFVTGPNPAGFHQNACVLCGNCCTGCNYNAKNTVLMNYLPDAHAHGADIFTEVGVRSVCRDQGKWRVLYDLVGERHNGRGDAPSRSVTADVVVLAAGTLGSTEILLRSKAMGLPVSDRLGQRFSGNGDVVSFAYDTSRRVRGVGVGPHPVRRTSGVGPTITGLIDLRDAPENLKRALIIEDGAIPGALAGIAPIVLYAAALMNPDREKVPIRRRLGELAQIPLGAYRGPVDRTLTYLIMSTDNSGGQVVLQRDRTHVEWPEVAEQPVFARDNLIPDMATEKLHGTFVPDPLWACRQGRSLITVHPVGGCVMADEAADGVVDHKGRVFDPSSDREVHEGLYVSDGSVIPRALDANPLLTISALAERTAELLIADRKWAADQPGGHPRVPSTPAPIARRARLTYSEHMRGFVSMCVRDGFVEGYECGRDDGALAELFLTIDYDDVTDVLRHPKQAARVSGTVIASDLSPHHLVVTNGSFTLLEHYPAKVEAWRMRYQLDLLAEDGKRYYFDGYKLIGMHGARYAWSDTTTLYATIKDRDGRERGVGILRMRPTDVIRLVRSISVWGVPLLRRTRYHLAFLRFFAGEMARIYGGVLDEPGAFPGPRKKAPQTREPRKPKEIWWCDKGEKWHLGDDVRNDAFLRLTRYTGGRKGPVILAPGFGMSSHSFMAPTAGKNLAEFLADHEYDIWLFDYRAGIDLPSARTQFTIDDIARHDWRLAVRHVLAQTGAPDLQAFGHCVGSVSLQMAILNGLEGIRTAICAQFPLHPVTSIFNLAKAELRVGSVLNTIGVKIVEPDNRPSPPDEALDVLLRTLPMPEQERCGQAVCRWINAIYGCTHRHAQLNDEMHRALNTMFGVGNIDALKHLLLMLRKHRAVTHTGKNDYFLHPERLSRTELLLLQGRDNYIFHPAGTLRTLRWLRQNNPDGHYERVVLPGYAHLDAIIGVRADKDVFPHIVKFLDRSQRISPEGEPGR